MTDLIWSPRLEKNIGYVWVPIGLAEPGTALEIEAPGRRAAGRRRPPRSRSSTPRRTSPSHDRPEHDRAPAVAADRRRDRRRPQAVPGRLAAARPGLPRPGDPRLRAEEWFRRDWIVVGREEDAPSAGTYFIAEVDDEPLLIARGRDGELRAFYNVCRHRGTAVVEEPCGKAVRFQCPYHAWIYDLEGKLVRAKHTDDLDDFSFEDSGSSRVRMETWQGFVFVSLSPEAPPLVEWLGDLPPHLARFDFSAPARRAHVTYEVDSELEVHRRELQRVLPLPGHPSPAQQADAVRPRRRLRADRPVAGRLDGARRDAETMAIDGGHRGGRPAIAGMTPVDERRIYYYLSGRSTFLSIHPDYLLVHRLEPAGADHTRIVCQWLFEPATIAAPGFDPSDAIAFWDLTNRQDWHVCELQHRGTRSRAGSPAGYSNQEPSVHAFDLMAVDRYANDGINSQRTGPPPLRRPAAEGRRGATVEFDGRDRRRPPAAGRRATTAVSIRTPGRRPRRRR